MLSHQPYYYYYQAHDQNQFLSAGQDLHKVLSDKEQKVISVSFADLFLKIIKGIVIFQDKCIAYDIKA